MPPQVPLIDQRNYQKLVDEALRRISVHNPEWTDFNQSDPGITLIQLVAFVADTLLSEIDERQRQRRHRHRHRLAVLVVGATGLGAVWWTTLKRRAES